MVIYVILSVEIKERDVIRLEGHQKEVCSNISRISGVFAVHLSIADMLFPLGTRFLPAPGTLGTSTLRPGK